MVVHLKDVFPEQCRPLRDEDLRGLIRHGVERAATYELTLEYDVCLYLHLALVLGRDFDRDPACHDVWRHLEVGAGEPARRMAAAYDAAIARDQKEG